MGRSRRRVTTRSGIPEIKHIPGQLSDLINGHEYTLHWRRKSFSMEKRDPSPSKRGSRLVPSLRFGLAVLILTIIVIQVFASASLTRGSLPRDTSNNVVDDPNGALGLDVADSISNNNRDRLVTVTNHGFVGSIYVTVALQSGSKATLYADGDSGNSVAFSLASGNSQTVDIEINGCPSVVAFDVTGASGIDVNAPDRQTSVTCGGPPGG